jgi:hypothetical protein
VYIVGVYEINMILWQLLEKQKEDPFMVLVKLKIKAEYFINSIKTTIS